MTLVKLIPYNAVDHFQDDESQAFLLADALESNDAKYIEQAFNIVSKARGVASDNVPSIVAMLSQMNLRLDLKPALKQEGK